MHIFTKVSKVPFSHLRSKGFVSAVFFADSYLQGNTYEACLQKIESTTELLQNLEFTIHPTKSILSPTQTITISGFATDSVQLTLKITEEKKNKIHNLCLEIAKRKNYFIQTR